MDPLFTEKMHILLGNVREIASHFFHCQGFSILGPPSSQMPTVRPFHLWHKITSRNETTWKSYHVQKYLDWIELNNSVFWPKWKGFTRYSQMKWEIVKVVLLFRPLSFVLYNLGEKWGQRGVCHPGCHPSQSNLAFRQKNKQYRTNNYCEIFKTRKDKVCHSHISMYWVDQHITQLKQQGNQNNI